MSALHDDSSASQSLCPLEDRRTTTEVFVKLFVVTFTVVCALLHLLKLRGELYLRPRVIIYSIVPAASLFTTIVPTFGALFFSTIAFLTGGVEHGRQVWKQTSSVAFGSLPQSDYTPLPASNGSGNTTHRKKVSKGKVIGIVAFLSQCVTSICLWIRRVEKGANSAVDDWVFGLALAGVGISIQTILILLCQPEQVRGPQQQLAFMDDYEERTFSESADLYLWTIRVGFRATQSREEEQDLPLRSFCTIFHDTALALFLYIFFVGLGLRHHQHTAAADKMDFYEMRAFFSGVATLTQALRWFQEFVLRTFQGWDRFANIPKGAGGMEKTFIGLLNVAVFLFVFVPIAFAKCIGFLNCIAYGMLGYLFAPLLAPICYAPFFISVLGEMAAIQDARPDMACPTLWTDPLAEKVWWLA